MKRSLFLLFAIVSVAGMIAFSGCNTDVTTYTVTFDANGGEGTMDTQLFTEDYEKALSANKFTREGFSFAGWNTMRDGTGTAYADQQKIKVVADMTLYAQWNEERPVTMHNGHEYIDLGLPSGNLWATCNIGADVPEAAGNYYAWAETAPKQTYTTENYPYIRIVVEDEDTLRKLTKYCPYSDYGYEGFTDELASLLAEDDAAAVNWGGQWKTPSEEDYMELIENCTITTDTINNVVGLTFKGTNGNSIFMPAVRYYSDEGLADYVCGRYWTSTLATDISYTDPICAMNCTFYLENEYADVYPWVRDCGLPVRAICKISE